MKPAWKGLFLAAPLLLAFILPAQAAGAAGRAAGSGGNDGGFGVWATENGYFLNKSGSDNYDGELYMLTIGVDKLFDRLLLGVAVTGEWLDLDFSGSGTYKSRSVTIAPYAAYLLRDDVTLDFSVGYTACFNDFMLRDEAAGYGGEYYSWSPYAEAGVTRTWQYDAWRFSSRLSAMYLHQSDDSFNLKGQTDQPKVSGSKYNLFQMQLDGRAGYDFGSLVPFVGVAYSRDIAKSGENNDMAGADFDLGLNWTSGPFMIGVTGTYGIRENFRKIGGLLNLRLEF